MINWIRDWWNTWRIWRSLDEETRAFLTSPHDPDDFVEVGPPEGCER
jgi:hypothetical protein